MIWSVANYCQNFMNFHKIIQIKALSIISTDCIWTQTIVSELPLSVWPCLQAQVTALQRLCIIEGIEEYKIDKFLKNEELSIPRKCRLFDRNVPIFLKPAASNILILEKFQRKIFTERTVIVIRKILEFCLRLKIFIKNVDIHFISWKCSFFYSTLMTPHQVPKKF